MPADIFTARSISRAIAGTLAVPFTGRILATFTRSCYLDVAGRIVALADPALEDGPFTVIVDGMERPFADLEAGLAVHGDSALLHLSDSVSIELGTAALWDPHLPRAGVASGAAGAVARRLSARAPAGSLAVLLPPLLGEPDGHIAEHAHFPAALLGMAAALASLERGEREGLGAAVHRLAGLGPGLTPSGDDFLAGVLLGLHLDPARAGHALSPAGARDIILAAARGRTTRISLAYLRAAADGLASAPWHRLVDALRNGAPECLAQTVDRILMVGETSGADMLTGFVAWLLP